MSQGVYAFSDVIRLRWSRWFVSAGAVNSIAKPGHIGGSGNSSCPPPNDRNDFRVFDRFGPLAGAGSGSILARWLSARPI
jgi:hypothetical protein